MENLNSLDDVAIFGAGPVGYFATMSSFLQGAPRVFSLDHWPMRLQKTKDLGAEIINIDTDDPVETIKKETGGKGLYFIWIYPSYGLDSLLASSSGYTSTMETFVISLSRESLSNTTFVT
jgi:threonine dehydrogenase-like Zn-dependent dehydrogenase